MNRNLVMIAGVVALVGLVVNMAFDLDNVYDMTTTGLWVLTLILALAGAFLGGGKAPALEVASSAAQSGTSASPANKPS